MSMSGHRVSNVNATKTVITIRSMFIVTVLGTMFTMIRNAAST